VTLPTTKVDKKNNLKFICGSHYFKLKIKNTKRPILIYSQVAVKKLQE